MAQSRSRPGQNGPGSAALSAKVKKTYTPLPYREDDMFGKSLDPPPTSTEYGGGSEEVAGFTEDYEDIPLFGKQIPDGSTSSDPPPLPPTTG